MEKHEVGSVAVRIPVEETRWGIEKVGGGLLNYDEIVRTFGEILAQADQIDHQGDSLYTIRKGDRFGFLTVGWGSCSGCDALEACQSQAELDSLQDDLERGILWFDSWDALTAYVASPVLDDRWLDDGLVKEFRAKVGALRSDGVREHTKEKK